MSRASDRKERGTVNGFPRSWRWDEDGLVAAGAYVRLSEGPSAYDSGPVPVVTLKVDGEERGIWLSQTALRGKFVSELERRQARDFNPGERITIERGAEKARGAKYSYCRSP
jgi:hypothetical protein